LVILFACTQPKQTVPIQSKFIIKTARIETDTIIKMAVLVNDIIICFKDNGRFLVLDSNYKSIDSISDKLNKLNATQLYSFNDTPIIITNKKCYSINNDLSTTEFAFQNIHFRFPNFIDSTYLVYSCCIGEFGGAVFFLNKINNKTYSYPSTCVNQVLRFKDNYIICNNLYSTNFISINDPARLFELKDDKQKNFCNWYLEVDSLKDYKKLNSLIPKGVVKYTDSTKSRRLSTMVTFEYDNELYSVISTDSLTLIKKHSEFNLITIDTLRKESTIGEGVTNFTKNGIAMAYGDTWTLGTEPQITNYVSSGLILIQGNRIRFIEFKTSHSWTESNSR
jgi:hypothetical protein